jgi:hypothetical protein
MKISSRREAPVVVGAVEVASLAWHAAVFMIAGTFGGYPAITAHDHES